MRNTWLNMIYHRPQVLKASAPYSLLLRQAVFFVRCASTTHNMRAPSYTACSTKGVNIRMCAPQTDGGEQFYGFNASGESENENIFDERMRKALRHINAMLL
jgi:hypothetical protein